MSKARKNKTILVLEDDEKVAASLCIRLRAAGYEVLTETDGLQGLTTAVKAKPDLIVSDVWMPGAVGFLVAERLKHFGLEKIPVIFISGGKREDFFHLLDQGSAAAFFEKPYDSEELLKAISCALARQPLPASNGRPKHKQRKRSIISDL